MTRYAISAALLGASAMLAGPALSQSYPCAPRDEIVTSLTAEFGERQKAMGLQQGENLMEIFASEESGSFTVLVTDPEGESCVVAMGSNWTDAMAQEAGQKISY